MGTSQLQHRPIESAAIGARAASAGAPAAALLAVPPEPALVYPIHQAAPGPDPELAALREKLAFYESFDQLINDTVARSARLFRSLTEERERMKQETSRAEAAAAATLEAERRLTAERERMQQALLLLMEEASRIQRQVDGLIQRIAEAITAFTVRLPEEEPGSTRRQAS